MFCCQLVCELQCVVVYCGFVFDVVVAGRIQQSREWEDGVASTRAD